MVIETPLVLAILIVVVTVAYLVFGRGGKEIQNPVPEDGGDLIVIGDVLPSDEELMQKTKVQLLDYALNSWGLDLPQSLNKSQIVQRIKTEAQKNL